MPFPQTPLVVLVEVALGADVTADPGTWVFTDVTQYIYVRDSIHITRGRPDEASTADPSTLTMTADNRTGRWSTRNPSGAWYGRIRKGVPVRVSAEGHVRFTGFITALPPRWDASGEDRSAPIEARGLLYRIGRIESPVRSPLRLHYETVSPQPLSYWRLEDGNQQPATRFASALAGGGSLRVAESTLFGVTRPFSAAAGSKPGPVGAAGATYVGAGGYLRGPVPFVSTATTARGEMSMIADSFTSTFPIHLRLRTPGVTYIGVVSQDFGSGHHLGVIWDNGVIDGDDYTASPYAIQDSQFHLVQLDATSSGGGADTPYVLRVDGEVILSGTATGLTWLPPTEVDVNALAVDIAEVAHLAAWSGTSLPDPADSYDAFLGHPGEEAHTRFLRLCAAEGIPATCNASRSQPMGPQGIKALLPLLRECEATDIGFLYDGLEFDLVYQSHSERYNRAPALALNYETPGHIAPPLEAIDDDADAINDVEVKTPGGDSYRATEEDPAVELSIPNIGRRGVSIEVNVADAAQLVDQAHWRLHLVDADEMFRSAAEAIRDAEAVVACGPVWTLKFAGSARQTAADLRALAMHEARHAVCAILVGGEVHSSTIGDGVAWTPCRTGDDFLDAVVAMAPQPPGRHDLGQAAVLIGQDRVEAARWRALEVLAGYGPTVAAVAEELARAGKLSGARIAEIVSGATPAV